MCPRQEQAPMMISGFFSLSIKFLNIPDPINNYDSFQMKDQLITQQIDVIVIGTKAIDLMELIFDSSIQTTQQKNNSSYLKKLEKMIGKEIGLKQSERTLEKQKGLGKISKYTKALLTQSFWLQFHFFVHNLHIYDPMISSMAGGNISICIMVNEQGFPNSTQLKKLMGKQNNSTTIKDYERVNQQKNARDQTMMEAKVFDILHSIKINNFSSFLCLKIVDGNRIIEESSNLRLSVNQILRWVVDRFFENQYHIRLKGELGDEIQNYTQATEERYCTIM